MDAIENGLAHAEKHFAGITPTRRKKSVRKAG
jgi:hypothetical protein